MVPNLVGRVVGMFPNGESADSKESGS
jgi:hypothetical protein